MRMSRRCGVEVKLTALRRTKVYKGTDVSKEDGRLGRGDGENDSELSDKVLHECGLLI